MLPGHAELSHTQLTWLLGGAVAWIGVSLAVGKTLFFPWSGAIVVSRTTDPKAFWICIGVDAAIAAYFGLLVLTSN